jgi:hypothetical protein
MIASFLHSNCNGPLAILSGAPSSRPLRSPQGVYDSNILCEECDNEFGKLDQHGCETLLEAEGIPIAGEGDTKGFIYDKADGSKLISFITSVAWRASKSKHDYFNRVFVGKYEELLQASFRGDVNAQAQLDCFIFVYDKRNIPQFAPSYNLSDGIWTLVISANRFVLLIKIYEGKASSILESHAIRPGSQVLSLIVNWEGSSHKKVAHRIVKANSWPKFWKNRK